MTNTVSIIRALLIYGLCLPLAVYLGYVLAMPLDRGSLMFLAIAILLPLTPVLLRWHHLALVLSWNMSVVLFFLPGNPYLWIFMAAVSLGLTVLNYILKREVAFVSVTSITLPLLFLAAVIIMTANLTGGIGIRSLGAEAYGGKRYVMLFGAIIGYFALTGQRVPQGKATTYVALYFLGVLTMIMGSVAPWVPGQLRYLYALFPVENLNAVASGGYGGSGMFRLGGVTMASVGVLCFILARHGLQGLLNLAERWRFLPLQFKGGLGVNQPWRILMFLGICFVGLLGGYRSVPITLIIILTMLFFIEGLHRTRLLPGLLVLALLLAVVTFPFIDRLPLTVQRSLSFLPIQISPAARLDAEASTEWRLRMWQEVIPTVPQYLLVGKGYAIDPRELQAAQVFSELRSSESHEGSSLASDYHSGPLSLIIPLGAFGALGFLWFLIASYRLLLNNYRHGDPDDRRLNAFILAYFLTKVLFFLAVYGSFQNDLMIFTGLVGLSASINGGMRQPQKAEAKTNPAYLPFRLPKTAKA